MRLRFRSSLQVPKCMYRGEELRSFSAASDDIHPLQLPLSRVNSDSRAINGENRIHSFNSNVNEFSVGPFNFSYLFESLARNEDYRISDASKAAE